MRVSELSERSGVSVATIKYYLREGLLAAGTATAPNQADYDERHLDRLLLIRALRDGGNLPVSSVRGVLDAMDRYRSGRPEYLDLAMAALSPTAKPSPGSDEDLERATAVVDELLVTVGWDVDVDSPGRGDLVRAVAALRRHLPGAGDTAKVLVPYARAMRKLADTEIPTSYDPSLDPAATLRYSVLGTVLFEPVILALRKLSHVDRIRAVRRGRSSRQTRGQG